MNENLIIYLLAYLIGSIPFGLLIAKAVSGVNIKEEGSGSIGATNVFRVLDAHGVKNAKKLSALTIVCDFLKGFLPIMIGKFAGLDPNILWTFAVLSVVGHCFSIFLKFEGGKGVATSFGVFTALLPVEAVLSLIIWFLVGKYVKISSLASLSSVIVFLVLSFIIHPEIPNINTHAPIIIIVFFVFYKHIPNIKRLLFKEEKTVL
ncbi:MAG: glycerol-3-phosphate 1-O-acyltransferase PlsY [Campylobacter sp.]|nr:glycerol-3-phosphate 1-O-acyltransferase PlsY [Campylobacter sp.]